MSDADPHLREQVQKGVMVALLVLGAVFIGVGAALGLGVAWVVYMLVEDPKSITLVAQLIDSGAKGLRGARGTLEGRPFEIELGEPLFLLLALFVGAIVLGIVAGIAKRLMLAGVELIRPVFK